MFRERRYRIHLVAFGLFLTGLIVVAIEVERAFRGIGRHIWEDGPSALLLVAAMWVLALFTGAVFLEYAGPDGLRGTGGLGRYHDVRWSDIRKVSDTFGILLIPHGRWGTALLFPKFLERWRGFREYVLCHAPEDNPLRVALRSGT